MLVQWAWMLDHDISAAHRLFIGPGVSGQEAEDILAWPNAALVRLLKLGEGVGGRVWGMVVDAYTEGHHVHHVELGEDG